MNKEVLKIEEISGKRRRLEENLPLNIPYAMQVMTAKVCNLGCEFCDCSITGRDIGIPFLSLEAYDSLISSMYRAKWKIKQVLLTGIGEPLLNKNIVEFIKRGKEREIAESIQLVTNGVLLTKEKADQLIEAELDVLRVSINGLTDDDYKKYTNKKIDFHELVENIKYYYNNKKSSMKLYVKIMSYMLDTEQKEEEFKRVFEKIADVVNIEHVIEVSNDIDYDRIINNEEKLGMKGTKIIQTDVCSMVFYSCTVNTNGSVSACCLAGPRGNPPALVMGNVFDAPIDEIWNGKQFQQFRCEMLKEGVQGSKYIECNKCKGYLASTHPEDIIEKHRDRILMEIDEKINKKV